MNEVIMVGKMASDPELRTTQGGVSVCTFRIAVNRRVRNADGTRSADFFPVVAWRQLGEICAKFGTKGRDVAVAGALQTRSYEKDKVKHYVTEIIADEVHFCGGRKDGEKTEPEPAPSTPEPPKENGFTEVEDELPF